MPENVFPTPTPCCPPGSGFLLLCLALQRACPVTLQGLVWPPRIRPGQGFKEKKPQSVYELGQRWDAAIHMPPLSSGLTFPGRSLLWSTLGARLPQTQGTTWWETPEVGHSFLSVLPSNFWAEFCLFWHRPDDIVSWPMILELGVLPLLLDEFTEAQGHHLVS